MSVLIPSYDGYRGGCVPRLLASVAEQHYEDYEVILAVGIAPQGRAINLAAAEARGNLLLILDDDSTLADAMVFGRLVETVSADVRIGLAGASIVLGPDATPFQRRAALQFPRFNTPVVETVTDSDLACHGCCVIPRAAFDAVGGEREDLHRGLDPDLRVRLRAAGYRVVLAPHARIHHPLPDGWPALLRTFFRNGFGSAYAQKFQPSAVYETHESLHDQTFRPRRPLLYRVARFPLRLLRALLRGHALRFGAYAAYALGYVWGLMRAKELPHAAGRRAA